MSMKSTTPGRLFLIRHAAPRIGAGICYGSTDRDADAAVSAVLAQSLAPRLPRDAVLYYSPLQRCRQLALPLADVLGVTPVADARLVEMHFGAWEMQPWDAIPRAEIDAWAADLIHYRPGGGESVLQAAGRASAFLTDVQALGAASVIAVCHAGSMRLLQALNRGLAPAEAALHAARSPHPIAYGELLEMTLGALDRTEAAAYTAPLAG